MAERKKIFAVESQALGRHEGKSVLSWDMNCALDPDEALVIAIAVGLHELTEAIETLAISINNLAAEVKRMKEG